MTKSEIVGVENIILNKRYQLYFFKNLIRVVFYFLFYILWNRSNLIINNTKIVLINIYQLYFSLKIKTEITL